MSGYIYGLICVAAAIGIAEALVPESAKTRPYLKLIFGLALLLVVVRPLGELVRALPRVGDMLTVEDSETENYEEIADGALADAYKKGISDELEAAFGLSNFEVGVMLDGEKRPQKVTVTLMGKDIFRDPYKIEAHIGGAFGCECIVVTG